MSEPSEYELNAWQDLQHFKGRPLSQAMRSAAEQVAVGVARAGEQAAKFVEKHPRTKAAVARGQDAVAKGVRTIGSAARKATDAVPAAAVNWSSEAFGSVRQNVGRISRVGLSPNHMVKKHRSKGHDVSTLRDLRKLDLEQIDAVRGRGASWGYPIAAALSGAGAGLVISGGELVTAASAGAAAAPGGATIAGAFFGDAAVVLALSSRAVGHVSLLYGYDPEDAAEKLFVMSVVNASSAMTATAKSAALADISRLTQALIRGKTWAVLDKSVVSQVAKKFADQFGRRLTKQGLGKVVPAAGILVGGTLNWSTLESMVDTADAVYRRRFLLEKYPHLGAQEEPVDYTVYEETAFDDETISVLDELREAGGPAID